MKPEENTRLCIKEEGVIRPLTLKSPLLGTCGWLAAGEEGCKADLCPSENMPTKALGRSGRRTLSSASESDESVLTRRSRAARNPRHHYLLRLLGFSAAAIESLEMR